MVEKTKEKNRFWETSLGIKIGQRYRCEYHDSYIIYSDKISVPSFDHWIPRVHYKKGTVKTKILCCSGCNSIKGSKVFKSIDEAREFIQEQKEFNKITIEPDVSTS